MPVRLQLPFYRHLFICTVRKTEYAFNNENRQKRQKISVENGTVHGHISSLFLLESQKGTKCSRLKVL